MTFQQLKEKALSLPYEPGVYIMRDKQDKVIYVGKAKKLKNRVTQYFQDSAAHTAKTQMMVARIDHFDYIVAASEFEALVLECSLIKRHMPKYNILLKDDKGYPYVRLEEKALYPTITMVGRPADDGASYYGPFGSRSITAGIIEALQQTLKLPTCHKRFPADIGKDRLCLHYHMDQCAGWCQKGKSRADYLQSIAQAKLLLSGNYKKAAEEIRQQMLDASERLEFELAAGLRNRLRAVEALGQKQFVTAGALSDTDVIGFGQTQTKACFAVLHFRNGNLLDKEYEVLSAPDEPEMAVSSLVKQYYLSRGMAPRRVLLPFALEDGELFSQLLEKEFGKKTKLHVPQRGEGVRWVELANKNATEEAERITTKEERTSGTLALLGKMLSMEPPVRIEAFDISNISGTDIVAGMVVFENGKPKKGDYKRFKIEGLPDQDDYASMFQAVQRRFRHYVAEDKGFSQKPDLLLIDGGENHVAVACKALEELELAMNVFGMVKDDRHRTRALVTSDGREIRIDNQQSVFALIGNIQEETHRFAISYHRKLRSKRLRYSELNSIQGIGEVRKQNLLKVFKSIKAISEATLPELEQHLPANAALAVYKHFHPESGGEENT